jgi:phospholipid/cholesterol/gamma-HCH transport system substrate-binding protein
MTEQNDNLPPMPASRGRHREAWVGLFAILGTTIMLATLFTLTSPSMFRGRYVLTAQVTDAGGIRKGDPVILKGVNIGRVQGFRITPEGVAVRLEILGEYAVPADSRVELRQDSIMGTVVADIIPGNSPAVLRNGQSLPGSRPEGLFQAMESLKDRAKGLLDQANQTLSKETVENIHTATGDLKVLVADLRGMAAEQRGELRDLSRSLRRSAKDVEKVAHAEELERAIKRIDSLTARLDDASVSLTRSSTSLETVLGRIERGEGTLGKLSKEETLYNNLNQAADNIKKLSEDIRRQPKKYLKLSLF